MKLFNMRYVLTLFLGLSFLFAGAAQGQTKEEIKQQAESKLKSMSPSEIDAKIRELGLTKAEAIQKASDLGISLQEYMSQMMGETGNEKTGTDLTKNSLLADSVKLPINEFQLLRKKKFEKVPGFLGRKGIDSTIFPFGYDIFNLPSSTYQPLVNVATPSSYQVGIGDEIVITVWGETKLSLQLVVNKEGNLIIPDVGPISVAGLTIQQLKKKMLARFTSVYASIKNGSPDATSYMDISLGKIQTLRVFVLGEVEKPGSYSVSSLSTVMTALYLSGGPTVFGSLRDIQVKRDGKLFTTVDMYDYILKADNSKDVRLQDGDIVFVKPAGKRVAIVGDLFRPGIYELSKSERLKDLLSNAGGILFDSYFNRIHVERIIPFEQRTDYSKNVLDIDLTFEDVNKLISSDFELQDGDIITIPKINEFFQNRVTISGDVKKPGIYELHKGMTVKDLILSADSLKYDAFSRSLIFRTLPSKRIQSISFNPNLALQNDEGNNVSLLSEDSVVIYSEKEFSRDSTVQIQGAVHYPGVYKRYQNLSLLDLIVLAGGTTANASYSGIEISHVDTTNTKSYATVEKLSISKEYWDDPIASSFKLKNLDYVFIPKDPKIGDIKNVAIFGRVKYPGYYAIRGSDEKIADIISRAGGLIEGAYLEASEYFRKSKGTGKVPLDMKNAYEDPQSPDNLDVIGGDSIYVWWKDDIVFVRGEVYVPSPVIYKQGASLDYYIAQAGGYTEDANDGATTVFLPTGKKWDPSFFLFPDPDILPGSTIIVPKKVERPDTVFPYVRDIVTTLASLAAITVSVVTIAKLK